MLLSTLLLAGCAASRPHAGHLSGAVFPPGVHAHGFSLEDQDGKRVSLDRTQGSVRVLAFLSPTQPAAVLVAQQIRGALDQLGARADGVRVLFVDTSDRPAARAYARARGKRFLHAASLTGRAAFLTGDPSAVRAVLHDYGIPPASDGERALFASTPVLLVDRRGLEREGIAIEQLTPESLARDADILLSR